MVACLMLVDGPVYLLLLVRCAIDLFGPGALA
jgi:hypothetical protein